MPLMRKLPMRFSLNPGVKMQLQHKNIDVHICPSMYFPNKLANAKENKKTFRTLEIAILTICTVFLFANTIAASNWYVSQSGSGVKNGIGPDNAWGGWSQIDWDTDGTGPDKGVGGGDTLNVIGTVRSTTYPINGYGLSENQRLEIVSYPSKPGKLWQGLEISGSDWKGPDAFGAYSKSVDYPTLYYKAVEWTSDPWTDAVILTSMPGIPDNTWTSMGLYYCDVSNKTAYYKPTCGNPEDKMLTAFASTSRAIEMAHKEYVSISGLKLNNPVLIYDGSDYAIIENCEMFCSDAQSAIQIGAYPGYTPNNYGIIRGNYIHDCGNGIYLINQGYGNEYNNDYWTVEYNYIANVHGTKDSHGIGVQGGTGSFFQYNSIYNAGSGITFWNATDQIMRNNTVRFNKVDHMGYYGEGNGNGRGIEFSGETADSNLTTGNMIYGNIVSDCKGVGIRSKMGIPDSGYSLKIFNNTVSDCAISHYIMPTNYEGFEVGAYFHNNISINPKSDGYHLYIQANGIKYDLSLDNNIYSGSGKFFHRAVRYTTLAFWQTGTRLDHKSLSKDPKLNKSLIPQAGGGGIDTGEDLSMLTQLGLHPATIFPTGVNNGNVVTAIQGANGFGWEIGAYLFPFNTKGLQPSVNLSLDYKKNPFMK
jgi:hypothetical protein